MDDIQERTLLEAIMSIVDKTLKRLSERFCSPESVDVADDVRKRLIEQVKDDLYVYEQVRDGKAVVVNLKDNSRETYAEAMVDCILKTIRESHKPPQHSEPLPD